MIPNEPLTAELHEYDAWPDVDETSLSEHDRVVFLTRKDAVKRACDGQSHRAIGVKTGIQFQNINYFLKRCQSPHPTDGRIWGFRILVPGTRSGRNKWTDGSKPEGKVKTFTQLLKKYPDIEELIIDLFTATAKTGEIAERAMLKKYIHQEMLKALKAKGVPETEYPWSKINEDGSTSEYKSKALRSVERFLDDLYDTEFVKIVRNYVGEQTARNMGSGKMGLAQPATRFLEKVELDAWKFDDLFEVTMDMGRYPAKTSGIQRPWFLGLLDNFTQAILAYLVVFAGELTQYDLQRLFKRFIGPWSLPELTYENLRYKEGAGMPSDLVPNCPYWLIDELYVDNAFIHTALEFKRVMTRVNGGTLIVGRYKTPKDRPYIERFNKKIAQASHRLPNTTWGKPGDQRRESPEEDAVIFQLNSLFADQFSAKFVGDYNATKQKYGLGNNSPLDMVRHCLQNDSVRCLLDPTDVEDLNVKKTRVVCADKKRGRRPYIQYEHVRYSSENLQKMPSMEGETLRLSIDVDNLQQITAFNSDGTFFDYLIPKARKWQDPHTLEYRKLFYRYDGVKEDPDSLHDCVTQMPKHTRPKPSESTPKPTRRKFKPLSKWSDDDGQTIL